VRNKDYVEEKINFALIFVSVLVVISVFSCSKTLQAVPVIPNEGIIEGRVLEYCITLSSIVDIKPDQTFYILKISVTASEDIEGKVNLTKEKVGKKIETFSKEKPAENLFNQRIRANVVYQGDERGGKYWIKNINILTEKEENP
jgi:hypothetical protein